MSYQTVAVVKMAPAGDTLVDYSDEVSGFEIDMTRTDREVPATYGLPDESSTAGPKRFAVHIKYNADYATSSLYSMLSSAGIDGDGDVDFSIVYSDATVSASNPKFTGTFTVTDITIGTDVNTYFQQDKTYRAKNYAKVTTP